MITQRNNILVPVDCSTESIDGLRTALDIARQTDSHIKLTHFAEGSGNSEKAKSKKDDKGVVKDPALGKKVREKKEYLRGLRIQYHIPKLSIDFKVAELSDSDEFEKYILKHGIDLVVNGRKSEDSDADFLLERKHVEGKEDERDVVVLAVDHYCSRVSYNKLLLNVDLQDYDEEDLDLAGRFVDLLNMEAFVALTNTGKKSTEGKKDQEDLKKLKGRFQGKNYTLLSQEVTQSHQQLNSAINDMKIDFMMATSRRLSGKSSSSFYDPGIHEIYKSCGNLFDTTRKTQELSKHDL